MRVLPFFVLVAIAAPAVAQPVEPPPPARAGLEFSAGLWGGRLECESQNGNCGGFSAAGGFNREASYFLNPRWGLYADSWTMVHDEDQLSIVHEIATVGLRWRPVPILTLQAGLGGAFAAFNYAGVTVGTT